MRLDEGSILKSHDGQPLWTSRKDIIPVTVPLLQQEERLQVSKKIVIMVIDLLQLNAFSTTNTWGGTLSTEPGVADILGLACGLEYAFTVKGVDTPLSTGLFTACSAAGLEGVQVLTNMVHPRTLEAANILGLGRGSVVDISGTGQPWEIDFRKIENALKLSQKANIVSISFDKVTTAQFATTVTGLKRIRALCDQYGAWLHLNLAIGLPLHALDSTQQFAILTQDEVGLGLADSISGNALEFLNIQSKQSIFLSRQPAISKPVFDIHDLPYFSQDGVVSSISLTGSVTNETSHTHHMLSVYLALLENGCRS